MAFGSALGDLGMVQQMLADSEIDIEASRALILRTAWELDTGSAAAGVATTSGAAASEATP